MTQEENNTSRNDETKAAPRRLWLDDTRPAPQGWEHAVSYDGAIALLSTRAYDEASLDHDLADWHYSAMPNVSGADHDYTRGPQEKTGYHVALWMVENSVFPPRVWVHSMNPAGAQSMLQLLQRYHPGGAGAVGRRHPSSY